MVKDRVDDPAEAGVERYVGLEHSTPSRLTIRRWGDIRRTSTATKLRFEPGDIIFGKRRAYQRKVAVADFDGICSAQRWSSSRRPQLLCPSFLPFFMQSDLFMRAREADLGGLAVADDQLDRPCQVRVRPAAAEEQRRIADALEAADACVEPTGQLR